MARSSAFGFRGSFLNARKARYIYTYTPFVELVDLFSFSLFYYIYNLYSIFKTYILNLTPLRPFLFFLLLLLYTYIAIICLHAHIFAGVLYTLPIEYSTNIKANSYIESPLNTVFYLLYIYYIYTFIYWIVLVVVSVDLGLFLFLCSVSRSRNLFTDTHKNYDIMYI